MGKMIKMAWWQIARGRMDKDVQDKFERAQKLAQERGVAVKISISLTVKPPRAAEPEYQAVSFTTAIAEPPPKSKEYDLVIQKGVAVSDAENHPDQEHLELEDRQPVKELPSVSQSMEAEHAHG